MTGRRRTDGAAVAAGWALGGLVGLCAGLSFTRGGVPAGVAIPVCGILGAAVAGVVFERVRP